MDKSKTLQVGDFVSLMHWGFSKFSFDKVMDTSGGKELQTDYYHEDVHLTVV